MQISAVSASARFRCSSMQFDADAMQMVMQSVQLVCIVICINLHRNLHRHRLLGESALFGGHDADFCIAHLHHRLHQNLHRIPS